MGGERRLWECGKPVRVFHHFHGRSEGGKGEVTFSLRPRRGRSLGSPFPPPSRPQAVPAAADFLFATFSFGGERMAMDQQTAMEQLRELYREKTSIWRGSWSL